MELEIKKSGGETFGIELTSKTDEEKSILNCFWDDGAKVLGVTHRDTNTSLLLTFAGLIGKSWEEGRQYTESKGLLKKKVM